MALMLNSLVHVVLYLYYGLTGIGIRPDWKVIIIENVVLRDRAVINVIVEFSIIYPFIYFTASSH